MRARALRWSQRVDRRIDRLFTRAEPVVLRWAHRVRLIRRRWSKRLLRWWKPVYARIGRLARWIARRLRPLGVLLLRLLGRVERGTRAAIAWEIRAATRASAVLTPERGIACAIAGASLCLLAAQFVDYRGVEVGQPGYAGLTSIAPAPTVGLETPTDAHSYLLVPLALLGAALGLAVLRNGRRALGRVVVGLGALAAVVVLAVDLPAGLDLSGQASRFAGATAVLTEGFYAQLAAAAGMMLGGLLLLYAPQKRPARTPRRKKDGAAINTSDPTSEKPDSKRRRARKASLARTQEGLAKERTSSA